MLYPWSPEWYLAYKGFVELDMYLWVHPADLAVHTYHQAVFWAEVTAMFQHDLLHLSSACGSPSSAL